MKFANVLMIAALTIMGASSFAQITSQPLTSKQQAGVVNYSQCPTGTALNGLYFTHAFGQNMTYQESFSALCLTLPQQNFFSNPPQAKNPALPQVTTQSAPPGGYMTGIGFSHNNGQDFAYQESVTTNGVGGAQQVYVGGNCHSVSRDRSQTQTWINCNSNEVVTSVTFSHPYGQDYTYQESVTLTCCPVH